MRFVNLGLLTAAVSGVLGAGWGFEDASITITTKGAGVGAGTKHKLSANSVLPSEVTLGAQDTLKLIIVATDNTSPTRPHQAFLVLKEPKTGLEESYMVAVNDKGKGKVEITQKDLPFQFLDTATPLSASLVIASFGASKPFHSHVFSLSAERDPAAPASAATTDAPLRYGSLPEIHHIFRAGPKSPPKVISFFFALCVLGVLPLLLGGWLYLGANIDHAGQAMKKDPVSHGLFYGSIVAMEAVFFLYYTSWNLFQTLPAAAVVGVVAVFSGSRALSEVQARRLAGLR